MPVEVRCPTCGVKLDIPERFLGKKVRCASCSKVFETTAEQLAPPAPAEASPAYDSDDTLPLAPLDEAVEPRRKRRPKYHGEIDNYDDRYDREEAYERRYRRRDLDPHRGGLVLGVGVASIILGAFGVSGFCCCFASVFAFAGLSAGIFSWLAGTSDLRRMDQGEMDPDGRSSTHSGYICGIVGTVLNAGDLFCSILAMIANVAFSVMNQNQGY